MCAICDSRDTDPKIDSNCDNMEVAFKEAFAAMTEDTNKEIVRPACEMLFKNLEALHQDWAMQIITGAIDKGPEQVAQLLQAAEVQCYDIAYRAGVLMGQKNIDLVEVPVAVLDKLAEEHNAKVHPEG